jgi:hypothetical protein
MYTCLDRHPAWRDSYSFVVTPSFAEENQRYRELRLPDSLQQRQDLGTALTEVGQCQSDAGRHFLAEWRETRSLAQGKRGRGGWCLDLNSPMGKERWRWVCWKIYCNYYTMFGCMPPCVGRWLIEEEINKHQVKHARECEPWIQHFSPFKDVA